MDLTIHLTPDVGDTLEREARRLGLPAEEVVARLLQERLTQGRREATRALLREWQEEDVTAEEREQGQSEWRALKTALDEDRPSGRKLFPGEP